MNQRTFAERLKRYGEQIGSDGVAVIHSTPEAIRNHDVHHPYRQSSDLYYLTGFAEPQATLIVRPGDDKPVTLFVRPRDPERETWDGRRVGVEGAAAFGANQAFPVAELEAKLADLLCNRKHLYYSVGINPGFDRLIMHALFRLRGMERKGKRPPHHIIDPRTVLHEMRLRKSPEELDVLRKACDIAAAAHVEAMKMAKPGVSESEVEAVVNFTFRKAGARGPGYQTIVGAGVNSTILHYVENNCQIASESLVLIDAGCEVDYYTSDITRTFPADGRFTKAQRAVYEAVLDAQETAIAMVKPGATLEDIHRRVVAKLTRAMVDLKLLQGPVQERIDDSTYKRFYMHSTSHWLGMDVHDAGTYVDDNGVHRALEPGMVLTVEPGLYIAVNANDVPREFLAIGIRIEDDVVVTANGCEVLSAKAPKQVSDIERICTR